MTRHMFVNDTEVCPLPAFECTGKFALNEPENDRVFKHCQVHKSDNFCHLEPQYFRIVNISSI